MNCVKLVVGLIAAATIATSPVKAAEISTYGGFARKVAANEAADGAPVDGDVYQFFTTTDGDIQAISEVEVTLSNGSQLYFNLFGLSTHSEPGKPILIPTFPAVGVDSWVTTPGPTTQFGAGLPGDGVTTAFGDITDDGPQIDFMFAQFTVPAGTFQSFAGVVSILGAGNQTYSEPFFIVRPLIPEPSGLSLLSVAAIVAAASRRWLSSRQVIR